ncbi:MAG: hypothetical protein WB696_07115 [Chthoniobacterales bacterium]
MADSACSRLGVPERLHRERREPNRTFDEDEELYHRFPGHLDDENLKEAISFEPGESYNRSKYCQSPADVLVDCEKGEHFKGWGVIAFPVRDLIEPSWVCDDDKSNAYSYQAEHKPTRCNYAHAELLIFLNGQPATGVRKAVRRKVRKAIVDASRKLRGLPIPS